MDDLKQQLIAFHRKFARLLANGVPVLKALTVIAEETRPPELRDAVAALSKTIEAGGTFSDGIAASPHCFSASVRALIRAGEVTGRLDAVCHDVAKGLEDGSFALGDEPSATPASTTTSDDAAPVIEFVSSVILQSYRDRASDIHFDAEESGKGRIRIRVAGVLRELQPPPPEAYPAIVSRLKIMANMNVAEKRLPQDGRIQLTVEGKALDLRVSSVPCMWGESLVVRLLSPTIQLPSLERIGFGPTHLATVQRWLGQPHGLILVTGPTGSGKTTTLCTLMQTLNRPEVKILSVEDPVEYTFAGISQVPVRPAIGLTFASILRSFLRQDPDIIMVGEIRDRETAQILIQAVLTGHLLLSTLHTNDACEAIRRLLDIGVEPFLLNAALTGVCAQRLVRQVCAACKREVEPKEWMKETLKAYPAMKLYAGKGCDQCHGSGYRGRVAIHELLELDDELRRLVARDVEPEILREQALRSGFVTMRADGMAKAAQGLTTVEEVTRVCAGR